MHMRRPCVNSLIPIIVPLLFEADRKMCPRRSCIIDQPSYELISTTEAEQKNSVKSGMFDDLRRELASLHVHVTHFVHHITHLALQNSQMMVATPYHLTRRVLFFLVVTVLFFTMILTR